MTNPSHRHENGPEIAIFEGVIRPDKKKGPKWPLFFVSSAVFIYMLTVLDTFFVAACQPSKNPAM